MTYRAFSLIETIAVVAILTVAGIALQSAITYFYKSNRVVLTSLVASNTARTATDSLLRNLREATYGDDGSYPLSSVSTSSIMFFSNTDSDARIEKVRWFLSNNTLSRGITKSINGTYDFQPEKINATYSFIQNASSTPLFRYFDSTGTEITSFTDLSTITSIQTTLSITTSTSTPNISTATSFASLRHLEQ